MTAKVFQFKYFDHMAFAKIYAPAAAIPSKCDACGEETTRECCCGEIFCSRACLRQAWRGSGGYSPHRKTCEAVAENGELAIMLTKLEFQQTLSAEAMQLAEGDPHAVRRDQVELVKHRSLRDSPQGRNFARMRLADRQGPGTRDPTKVVIVAKGGTGRACLAFKEQRLRDPIFAAASKAFERVLIYENAENSVLKQKLLSQCTSEVRAEMEAAFRGASAADCVRALTETLNLDDTALQLMVEPPGFLAAAHPRMMAAVQQAAAGARTHRAGKAPPGDGDRRLEADALVCLASLSVLDQSLGTPLGFMEKVFARTANPLRAHLSDEASAVFKRGCFRAMAGDPRGALKDCLEATALAHLQQKKMQAQQSSTSTSTYSGLAWSFSASTAKNLVQVGRVAEALELFEEEVDAAYAALRDYPDGGSAGESPVTGGRERDPHKLAKVIECEYHAAYFLLEAGSQPDRPSAFGGAAAAASGKPRDLVRRGRARYASAAAREQALSENALPAIPGEYKAMCQAALSKLPATEKTQAAINAGAASERGSGLLECHGCGGLPANGGLKACSGCKEAAYCSQSCQKAHWNIHKPACKKAISDKKI